MSDRAKVISDRVERPRTHATRTGEVQIYLRHRGDGWAAAGFEDTMLGWNPKPEVVHGNETAVQPGVQA